MNDPTGNERFQLVRIAEPSALPPIRVTEVFSEQAGKIRKILDMDFFEDGRKTKVVSVTCDENDKPFEKFISYKHVWDMQTVCDQFELGARVHFKHLVTERYEKTMTFLGTYQLGTKIEINEETARTMVPPLLADTLEDEIRLQIIDVPAVDESRYVLHDGWCSKQRENAYLTDLMYREIENLVRDFRAVNMCHHCEMHTCVWQSNRQELIYWDALQEDGEYPTPNVRRKALYRQITLIINDGPMGRGNRMRLPQCVLIGIRGMYPEENDNNYMGHRDV